MAPLKVTTSGWSKKTAKPGDDLALVARLVGFAPNTRVTFRIFTATGDPGASLATLSAVSNEKGLALAPWAYVHDPIKVKEPKLLFEATAEGAKSISNALTIVDSIELSLADEEGKPVAARRVQIVDALGVQHAGNTTPEGKVAFDGIACGDCIMHVQGWQIVGELRRGEKKFRTGQKHSVTMREMKFTIEIESPKAGEIFLAGDRVAIKARVLRAGKPWDGDASFSANNGARVIGKVDAGKGTAKGQLTLVLPSQGGEVELSAKYEDATAVSKIKVVRPYVKEITFEGPDALKLWDHARQQAASGSATLRPDGEPTKQHPAAVRMGKPLKVKIRVATAEQLTRAARIEIALQTPPLNDAGLPAGKLDKALANKPLTLRLPKAARDAGAEIRGGEDGTVIELESDRPMPACIRSYEWSLQVRLNQKTGAGWALADGNLPIWPLVGNLDKLRVNAVFAEAPVGNGAEPGSDADPLKRAEYDPFHVRRACEWADGTWNLKPDHAGSIPLKLAKSIRHYRWPEEYHWLNGRPKADQPRPDPLGVEGIHPGGKWTDPSAPEAKADPVRKNWGWGVLDSRTPGGKSEQVASLVVAALATLGVKAKTLFLRARKGGGVNKLDHDPTTRGAPCHDPAKHWGPPAIGVIGIPADTSRDGDLGEKLHPGELWVMDPVTKKAGLHKDAATTGHDLKIPDYTRILSNTCRCGHEFGIVTRTNHVAKFRFIGNTGTLDLGSAPVALDGDASIQIVVPATLYGSDKEVPSPYGGQVVLTGPGGKHVKQLGTIKWSSKDGQLTSNRIEFRGLPKGAYQLGVNAFFSNVPHHPAHLKRAVETSATVIFESRQPGTPKPERRVEKVVTVTGTINFQKLEFAEHERVIVTLIDGWYHPYVPSYYDSTRRLPIERVNAAIGAIGGKVDLERGKPREFPKEASGLIFGIPGAMNLRLKLESFEIDPSAKPKPCPTCGAQANWGYKCAQCQKPVDRDAKGKHACGGPLEGLLAESILYPCPNCKKSVQDGDADCWSCNAKLQPRKPADRFAEAPEGTAQGGDKQEAKKDEPKKEEESSRPAGRFDFHCQPGPLWHGILTIGPEGQPSFVNFGYYHDGYSREDVKDVKWDEGTKTLTFTRIFENRWKYPHKLTFKADGTFEGTYVGYGWRCWGGIRKEADATPIPNGRYDWLANGGSWSRGQFEIKGDDPDKLTGVIHQPGYPSGELTNVKWDALNHTLAFFRPAYRERGWITFRENGAAYHGVLLQEPAGRWLSFSGRRA